MKQEQLYELQKKINYQFSDSKLFTLALTHSSFSNDKAMQKLQNNERLEFLGDAVLELVTSEVFYLEHAKMQEGELTKLRASMVCEPSLAFCAKKLQLGSYLLLGKGEIHTGGRERNSILSDALEALIGAIYLDGGFDAAKTFIHTHILAHLKDQKHTFHDSKTMLQELVQGRHGKETIQYCLVAEEGPDHNKKFKVNVLLGDRVLATGIGKTKKAAEQEAAQRAILQLK